MKYNVELLNQQWLGDASKDVPKTPPNPLKNDKDSCRSFYLAEAW